MAYDLYIDVLFAANVCMDVLLLVTLKGIMKLKSTPLRLFLSGSLGAVWACILAVFPGIPEAAQAAGTYGLINGLMVWTAFRPASLQTLGKEMAGLVVLALLYGGVGSFFYWHTPAGYHLETGGMPLFIFILTAAGGGFGIRYALGVFREKRDSFYEVTLHYGGSSKTVRALLDTGNHLAEPETGKPVSVISRQAAEELCRRITGFIYVPYRSVGRERGLLVTVKMDAMEICQGDFYLRVEAPFVGISKELLSGDNSFDMLLNEKLFD